MNEPTHERASQRTLSDLQRIKEWHSEPENRKPSERVDARSGEKRVAARETEQASRDVDDKEKRQTLRQHQQMLMLAPSRTSTAWRPKPERGGHADQMRWR